MDKPFFTNLHPADQLAVIFNACGFEIPAKWPKKGEKPLTLDFTGKPWNPSCAYGEVEWTEHQSDTRGRLYRYSIWKDKPVALPTSATSN